MRSVKDKGMEELKSYRNRLYRSVGMEKINEEDFEKMRDKVNDLIELTEKLDEEEE